MDHLEIISETPSGVVSYCPMKKQHHLAFKNMIVLIPGVDEFKRTNSFFQNMPQSCCGKHSHLNKKYVFGIHGTQTFFAYDSEEINELKELLANACFQIELQEMLNEIGVN
jgi:hypothetical protein